MPKVHSVVALALLAALLAAPAYSFGTPILTSWIFRSAVADGQSFWGPGSPGGHNFSDSYLVTTWPFAGTGFSWSVAMDPGSLSGNVEGAVKAKYDNHVTAGKTTIALSYSGIENESRIGANSALSLTATPRFAMKVLPWPFPSIDWSMPISAVNMSLSPKGDFTTGLNSTVAVSGAYEILPFSLEAAIFSAYLKINADQDILFTPQSITGKVNCTHAATGAKRAADVTLTTDGADVSIEVDLDIEGHWEICLDEFTVDQNVFQQDLGLMANLGVGIPMLGAGFSLNEDSYFQLWSSQFQLDFDNHGYDGDPLTADNLGRFSIYVDAVPEPASLATLVLGGVLALWRRRRR